jgi:hypothetical protein
MMTGWRGCRFGSAPPHPRFPVVLVLALVLTGCRSTGGGTRIVSYVDDVADTLGMTRTQADDFLSRAATSVSLEREVVAQRVLSRASTLRSMVDDADTAIAGLRARADDDLLTLEDYVFSVLCQELLNTLDTGTISSPEQMYERAVRSFGEELTADLWDLGWLHDVEEVVIALANGDPEGAALAFAEAAYC